MSVPRFKKVYIEITNCCNLACSFCFRSRRPESFMDQDFFAFILEQVKPHTDHLCLHVLGEPLLHPDLGTLLDRCQEQGLRVNLTTNGTLLSRRLDLLLSRPALRQINISLHSQENDTPLMEEYLTGVRDFIRLAAGKDLYISLRIWDSQNLGQSTRMLTRLTAFFNLGEELVDTLTPGQGIALAPRVFLSIAKRFTWPRIPGPDYGTSGFCQGLRTHAAILADGTVVPCCLDAEGDLPLGNINLQTFASIISGERATRIRNGFKARKVMEHFCRRCSYRLAFK